MSPPDLSVVIVSWNTIAALVRTLDSMDAAVGSLTKEVVVVDNASVDGSPEVLAQRHDIRLLALDENSGFTRAANLGARSATGELVLFLNPDAIPMPASIGLLANEFEAHPEAWGATSRFRYPDGEPQFFWIRFPGIPSLLLAFTRWGRAVDRLLGRPCLRRRNYVDLDVPTTSLLIDCAGAACLLVRRVEFLAAGGFDERFFNFFQDGEFARRMARQGRRLLGVGAAETVHEAGGSIKLLSDRTREAQFLYAYRQYLSGERSIRRLIGEASVRIELRLRKSPAPREEVLRAVGAPRLLKDLAGYEPVPAGTSPIR